MSDWIATANRVVPWLDALSLAFLGAAGIIIASARRGALSRHVQWAIVSLLVLLCLHSFGNILERIGITDALDYSGLLLDGLFFFVFFVFAQEEGTRELRRREQQLQAANEQLRANEQQLRASNQQLQASEQQFIALNQRLRDSGLFLESVLDAIQDGISVLDTDLTVMQTNRWMERMYAEHTPLVGRKCYEAYQDRTSPCPWCPTLPTLQTGESHMEVVPYPSVQNPTGWIELSAFPVKDGEGRVTNIIEYVKDITDRRRAEEGLRASEAKMRSIFRAAPIGIGLVSKRVLITVNDRLCEMLGYSAEELVGESARILYPTEEDYDYVGREKYRQIEERGSGTVETRFLRKDGEIIDILLSSTPLDPADLTAGVTFTALNITARNRAQHALRENQRRLATLLSNLPGMAYRCGNDPDWTMEFVSDGSYLLTGYKPEDLVGSTRVSYAELIHSDDRQMVWDSIQAALEKKGSFQLVYRIRTADADERWVWEQGQGVFAADDSVIALEGFITDITQRVRAEQEREQLLRVLEAKNEELESIIYVSSHDLRAPLVNIQGFSGELKQNLEDLRQGLMRRLKDDIDPPIRELLERDLPESLRFIISGAEKMDVLLSGLLRLCRLGRLPVNIRPVDMTALLQRILESVRYQIEQAEAEVHIGNDLPRCLADPDQLNQVLTNLLDNAIKYRHPKRKLRVAITARQQGAQIVYSLSDNGRGIDPDHQKKVFEIFHRLEPEGQIAGEGLGLSIVKRLVSRLNGDIDVESNAEGGTTFHLILPTA